MACGVTCHHGYIIIALFILGKWFFACKKVFFYGKKGGKFGE